MEPENLTIPPYDDRTNDMDTYGAGRLPCRLDRTGPTGGPLDSLNETKKGTRTMKHEAKRITFIIAALAAVILAGFTLPLILKPEFTPEQRNAVDKKIEEAATSCGIQEAYLAHEKNPGQAALGQEKLRQSNAELERLISANNKIVPEETSRRFADVYRESARKNAEEARAKFAAEMRELTK